MDSKPWFSKVSFLCDPPGKRCSWGFRQLPIKARVQSFRPLLEQWPVHLRLGWLVFPTAVHWSMACGGHRTTWLWRKHDTCKGAGTQDPHDSRAQSNKRVSSFVKGIMCSQIFAVLQGHAHSGQPSLSPSLTNREVSFLCHPNFTGHGGLSSLIKSLGK